MKPIGLIMSFISIWVIFGGLLAVAIIFDDIYIQLLFDFGIMLVAGISGYYLKGKQPKD